MSNAVNNSSRSNQRPSQTANPGVGAKYEVRVATLVAAILSTNPEIENYQIFSNLGEALPFDDVVAKVYFKGETTPYAFAMQVKHLLRGERFDMEKYLKGYRNIVKAGGLQTIDDIDVNNIHFCYFSVNNVRTTDEYKLLPHNSTNEWWRLAFPFEHCQKLDFRRNINETENKERKDFLDKFCLYFYQPGMDLIEERIKEICNINDAADILKYVDRFFEKEELWGKGLSKAVFETELLKIRLSDYILSPEDVIQLNDLPVAIWNQLTLLHDVTIVEDEANIEKCLYGCLTQMLNRLLNNAVEWNEHERKKLNSTVISKFKELFTEDEPVMVRHWISPPTTLKELIIELWKCGKLPLILKTEEELSVLKAYAHLHKKYIIITKKLVIRREEIDKYPLSVFTRISDANKCLEVRDELLRAISASIHGRKPITLYSMVNGHEELTTTLSCAHILHLMKTREVYLSKECLDIEQHDMIFLINDPNCTAEYNIDSVNKIIGNTAIWCRPDESTKYRQEIEKIRKLEGYEIYNCTVSPENEHFILNEGNEMLLRDYFVDQYGESVYNLKGDIVPILGNNFQSIQQDYIPRFLCNAIVSKSLFDSPTKGICFCSGDLTCLDVDIEKHILELSLDTIEEEMLLTTENYFVKVKSEDINNYWIKATKLRRPLLHIRVEGSNMYLSNCKNWNGLSDHISFSGQKIPEKRFLTELTGAITVLTGEPGIGKSFLLRSLFKNHGLEKYILFYNLTDYKKKKKNKLRDINSSLDFILNKVKDTRYSEFLSNLFKRKEKLLVVLDSFDEILPSRKEYILNFIRNLVANNIQIIIASRLIANYILMDNFEVNIFKVDILNEENRKEYISNCKLDEEMLTTIPPEFLENPLHLNLLKLISQNGVRLSDVNKFLIFEKIVDIKLNQYFEKYYSDDHESDKGYHLEHVLEIHFKLALVRIVGVDAVEKLLGWTCEKQLSNQMKLGITLSMDEDGYPTFVHETFAEYLAAAWIVKNKNKDSARKIYMEILNQEKLYVLDILCDHMQLHKACVKLDTTKIEMYSNDRSHLEKTDALGRTVLHVFAARYHYYLQYNIMFQSSLRTIICNMHRLKVNYTNSDDLMEWNWVQHLYKGNHIDCIFGMEVVDPAPVLEAYAKCIVQKLRAGVELCIANRSYYEAPEIYKKAIKARSIDLIRDLFFIQDTAHNGLSQASTHRECQALETDELNVKKMSGFTALHIACIYGNAGTVSRLVSVKHDVNVMDNFGCTPLHYSVMHPLPISVDITKILIENGAKIDVANRWKDIAVYIAVRSINLDLTKLLLDRSRGTEVVRLCLLLALKTADKSMIELLLEYQPDADIVSKDYFSTLLFFSIIQTYSLHRKEVGEKYKTGFSKPAKKSNLDCMKLLLEYGANANDTIELSTLSHILTPASAELLESFVLVAFTKTLAEECQTPLMLASAGGSSDLAMLLLEKGANVNSRTIYGKTALMFASEVNNSDVAKLLLEKGASVNSTTIDGKTALMFASERNCLDVVKLLLEKNANLDITTTDGKTALMFASQRYNSDVAKLLLEKNASVHTATVNGETALMLASEENNFYVAKLLLEKNASVDTSRTDGETALMLALGCGGIRLAKLLIDRGASVNSTTGFGKTPLMCAAKIGSLDMTKLLIEKSANVNSTTINGKTALMIATKRGRSNVAKLLIEAGANIHTTTAENKTALTFACEKCNLEITTLLLALGADVNSTTRDGRTPLMLAAKCGRVDVLNLLLNKGADVNSTTIDGRTPLMFALENNNLDAAKLIIEKGASVNSTTTDGTTPLMLAANLPMLEDEEVAEDYSTTIDILAALKGPFKSYDLYNLKEGTHVNSAENDAARLLPENGAAVNSTANGEIPLTLATRCNRADVVKLLLEKGADINMITPNGKTPLMFASEVGSLDVAQLLLEKGIDVNTATERGKTALIFSIQEGQYSATELLLMKGADVNHITKRGRTPLFFAIRRLDAKITKLLLQRGANVNSTTSKGETPLFYMLKWCPLKTIALGLKSFRDAKASKRYDEARSYYAIERDRAKVVKLLLEYGADVNRSTRYGRTPLYYAIVEDRVNNVKLLLEHGADVNRPVRRDGTTPLDLAVKLNSEKIVELLLEYGAKNSKKKRSSLPRVKASILRRSRYF